MNRESAIPNTTEATSLAGQKNQVQQKPLKDFDFAAAFAAFKILRKREGSPVEPGARMLFAMGGRKWYRRLTKIIRNQPGGKAILREKPSMGDMLNDWDGLRTLPHGSVGREYLRWAEERQFRAKALEEEVSPVYEGWLETPEQEYVRNRSRDLHDLFHVLTGYDTDSGGETALLMFSCIQHQNPSMRVMSWIGKSIAFRNRRFDIISLRRDAKRRAKNAALLVAQPWEKWIDRPLEEVRAELNLLPLPEYQRFNLPDRI